MPNIGLRIQRRMKRMQAKGLANSGPVTLRWRVPSGATEDADENLRVSRAAVTYTEETEVLTPFIHYVSIYTTGYSRFTEIKTGDVILDFMGDVQIDGREALQFEIGGIIHVQKNAGKELAECWDLVCNGVPISRTVLVTRKT